MVNIHEFLKNQTTIKQKYFEKIADIILNKTILEVNSNPYRICEIEFYLNNFDHPDEYTHSDRDQLSFGFWYFHKYRNGNYKAGNYKGMDIALGNKNNSTFCGILIRSIYSLNDKVMIEGPCNSVNKILSLYGIHSINEFVGYNQLNVRDNHRNFCLVDAESKLKLKPMYKGIRFGLSDKYPEFRTREYRFLIFNDLINKDRKSRVSCKSGGVENDEDKSSITSWV